jgi:hypothetical protein
MTSDAGPKKPRRAHRTDLDAEVRLRRSGALGFRVRVLDASCEGCKVEFVERPAIEERVWVRFDGLEAIEGSVRWVAGHTGGVKFLRPLHEAVFERLAEGSKRRS